MKPSTLDILDKDLFEENRKVQGSFPETIHTFYAAPPIVNNPQYWDKYYFEVKDVIFNWQEFKYQDVVDKIIELDDKVGRAIGVYLMIVRPETLIADCPKFVAYVGIAGERGSGRSLNERLKDYFRLDSVKKRPKVYSLLCKYRNFLYIKFSPLEVSPTELEKIEMNLHGFFMPPFNERDFPVEIKNIKKSTF